MTFSEEVIGWYEEHGRQLPWRGISNAYYIWLSEIILQQTRIEQGRSYYERFISTYPAVQDLAAAGEEQVLKTWQGLGYYSRARNLHAAARHIVDNLDGRFPDTYEGILALKGVGRYTAAAIASFAYKLPYPVIDGNVYRLVSRCFGIATPIGTNAAYNEFEALLLRLMDKERPDVFNQAMMDFGSMQCRPFNVRDRLPAQTTGCGQCVLAHRCIAFREGKVGLLPVKSSAVPVKKRYFYYIDIRWQEKDTEWLLAHRRADDDIWRGLYEVPLLELRQPLPESDADSRLRRHIEAICGRQADTLEVHPPLVHKLTHRDIVAVYVVARIAAPPLRVDPSLRALPLSEWGRLPVSRLMERLFSKR